MNKITIKDKMFYGSTINEVEDLADEWLSGYIREVKELRSSWRENGMFVVKVTAVVKENRNV